MLTQATAFMLWSALMGQTTASSTVGEYYQCGGLSYTGATQCGDGLTCSSQNPYYFQCKSSSGNSYSTASAAANDNSGETKSSKAVTVADTTSIANVVYSADTSDAGSEFVNARSSTAGTKAFSTGGSSKTSSAAQSSDFSGSSSSSGSSSVETLSGGISGTNGATTHYWDCCKPAYGWDSDSTAKCNSPVTSCDKDDNALTDYSTESGCSGGDAFMCSNQIGWEVSDDLAYGFAAAVVDGMEAVDIACTCFQLTFTESDISGKSMVVQVTNTGTYSEATHFDLAMPGGGVGEYTTGCSSEFSSYSGGQTWGGMTTDECDELPTVLQTGCNFRFDWFQNVDNPTVDYVQVVCPSELTALSGCSRTDE